MASKDTSASRIVQLLLLWPFTIAVDAVAASALWRWFVTPLGAPEITLAHAYGLATLVGWATYQFIPDREPVDMATSSIGAGLAALGMGWLALQFMT
jgi:hypothetical protein